MVSHDCNSSCLFNVRCFDVTHFPLPFMIKFQGQHCRVWDKRELETLDIFVTLVLVANNRSKT